MLLQQLACEEGGGRDLTYAAVDEFGIIGPKRDFVGSGGEDEFLKFVFVVLQPFVEVCTASGVERGHDLPRCKESDVWRKAVELWVGLNRNP